MKNQKNCLKPTIVLKNNNPDGFLDFNNPLDFSEAIKALNKLNNNK